LSKQSRPTFTSHRPGSQSAASQPAGWYSPSDNLSERIRDLYSVWDEEALMESWFVILLLLACPLGMVVIGLGAWVIARVRGEQREGPVLGSSISDNSEHLQPGGRDN